MIVHVSPLFAGYLFAFLWVVFIVLFGRKTCRHGRREKKSVGNERRGRQMERGSGKKEVSFIGTQRHVKL